MNEIRIAMWSGPRNLSTAMMRSFENRQDTTVLDEPFYAHYLSKTGLDHPGRAAVLLLKALNGMKWHRCVLDKFQEKNRCGTRNTWPSTI